MKLSSKQAISLSIASIVAVSPFAAALAATTSTQVPSATATAGSSTTFFQPTALGKVNLTANSAVQLKRVTAFQGEEGKTFYYIATIYNNGNTELDFNYYWFKVSSVNGAKYSLQMVPGKEFDRVPPNSKRDFHFYVTTPSNVTGSDLKLEVIRWDFNAPNYERKLGEIGIPKTYKNVAPAYSKQNVLINEFPIQASVTRSTVTKDKSYQYLSLTLEISNQGTKSVKFPEYTMYLKTRDGLLYPLQTDDLKDLSINPRDTKEIDLVATVPNEVKTDFSQLVWTQTASNKEGAGAVVLPLAFFLIPPPSEITSAEPTTGKKTITMNEKNVDVFIKSAKSQTVNNNHNVTITLGLENQDTTSTKVPLYDITLRTKEGYSYTMDTSAFKDAILAPKVTKEVPLTAVLPSIIDPNGLTVEITEAKDPDSKIPIQKLPIAAFYVTFTVDRTYALGDIYTYSDDKGTYDISLTKIQRMPWEDEDMITLHVNVKNNGNTAVPLPQWAGSVWFDGVDGSKFEAKRIALDDFFSIPPKSEAQLVYLAKIPYTYSFNEVNFELSSKVGETSSKVFGFEDAPGEVNLQVLKSGEVHNITATGIQSSLVQKDMKVYTASNTNLFYGTYELTNLESRQAFTAPLVGFYKTTDGTYYKANITPVNKKITPNGKVLLAAKAELPKTVNTEGMQLILGLGITDDKLTPNNGTPNAYVNAVGFETTASSTGTVSSLNKLEIEPYTLTLSKIQGRLSSSSVSVVDLSFNYTLTSTGNEFEVFPADHKILFELTDSWTNTTYTSTEKTLNDPNDANGFKTGENRSMTISFSDFKMQSLNGFKVTVYDVVDGHKIPIASSSYDYFKVYE
ncbi:hypothetical protein [Paenibacillus thermotolerans]|uniref:hypothetical protein n=1 Tax=Paenibacillus thermotolerans TaxID=3027807 RepID=UPI0023683314|nr:MULTISPECIES: hypothetical protein [unclassified Paenibacillus]